MGQDPYFEEPWFRGPYYGDSGDVLVRFSTKQQANSVLLSSGSSGLAGGWVPDSMGHSGLIKMVINCVMSYSCLRMTASPMQAAVAAP